MPGTLTATLDDLAFLNGRWQLDSFIMDFNAPWQGMLFGSMQEGQDGVTRYWETFRFVQDGQGMSFYPTQMGREVGHYRLVALTRQDGDVTARFETADNPKVQVLHYRGRPGGTTLYASVDGQTADGPFHMEWTFQRAARD